MRAPRGGRGVGRSIARDAQHRGDLGEDLIGRLDPLGRRLLIRLYMRAYRRSAPLDQPLVDRWTPLVAVVRLTAGIPEERGRLIEMFESSTQLNGR